MKSFTLLAAVASVSAVALADAGSQPSDCVITTTLPTVTITSCNPDGIPGGPPPAPINDQPHNPEDNVPGSNPPASGDGGSPPSNGNGDSPPSNGPGEPGQPGSPDGDQGSDDPMPGGGNGSSPSENPDQPETVPEGGNGSGNPEQPDTVPIAGGSKSKASSIMAAVFGFIPFVLL